MRILGPALRVYRELGTYLALALILITAVFCRFLSALETLKYLCSDVD